MYLQYGKSIISAEAKALEALSEKLDISFMKAIDIMYKSSGNIIISGVGKSGYIARKIAATFTSVGSPSLFLHPTEASHGDLGFIRKKDILVILSNSGASKELIDLMKYAKKIRIPIIIFTSVENSYLAKIADCKIILPKVAEVGRNNIAPTSSTTMMLSLGDALALSLSEKKKFPLSKFSHYHPGGSIGNKFIKVCDIMHTKEKMPLAYKDTNMKKVLIEMSKKSFGCIGVLDKSDILSGIITDGDLRRKMSQNLLKQKASDIMSKKPKAILENTLVTKALKIFNEKKITALFIIKTRGYKKPIGIIHLHDCIRVQKDGT